MNKKGKQINRSNKPPNSTPPQTDDKPSTEPEKTPVEEITKKETKVAEIAHENIAADDDDFESPKKPKRNRAKKKKDPHEVEDLTQAQAEKEESNTMKEAAVKSESEKVNADETKPVSPVPIEAAGRKKKEKKGAQKAMATSGSKEEPAIVDFTLTVETQTTDKEDQENKTKKKNKKGKKRTDSERSDKGEETLLCTAAFQKILQPRTDFDTKKEGQKIETSEPKLISEPVIMKQGCDVVNKEIKSDKKDKQAPIKIVEPITPIKTKNSEKKNDSKKENQDAKIQDKDEKTETKGIKLQQTDICHVFDKFEEPITIPEKMETVIDKMVVFPQQTPPKPKKEKHKGKKDSKEVDNILTKEPESVISQDQFKKEHNAFLSKIEPIIQAAVETKIVEDVANFFKNEASRDEMSQCAKKHKKDKKSKVEVPLEDKMPQTTHKETIIEPVKLADILNLLDPTTKQKIENQQIKLITDDPVIPKAETQKEQSIKESHIKPSIELISTSLDTKPAQDTTTIEKEFTKPTEIKIDENKNTGAKPKAKIAKPVEKSKGKPKPDISTEIEVLKDTFSSESSVETYKDDIPKHDTTKDNIRADNIKKEIIVAPEKCEAVAPLIETSQIKMKDKDALASDQKGNTENFEKNVVVKPASDVLLEKIEKPLQTLKESNVTPIQADVTNLQCPQDKSKKKRKSPKPEKKTKDASETALKSETKDVPNVESPIETEIKKQKVAEKLTKEQDKVEDKPLTLENLTDTDEELASLEKKIVTPDQIEHPRSASVQYTDRNNNMQIEEIIEPFTIPIIDEVSLLEDEPGNVLVDVTKPATKVKIATEPEFVKIEVKSEAEPKKTDLKSKVLEVNKDMEGLRLSIEKSLAELSALEKCEEEIFKPILPQTEQGKDKLTSESTKNQPSAGLIQADVKVIDAPAASQITSPISIPKSTETKKQEPKNLDVIDSSILEQLQAPPTPPQRKDNKGKNKSKKGGKQETSTQTTGQTTTPSTTAVESQKSSEATQKEEKKDSKSDKDSKNKEKQQKYSAESSKDESKSSKPSDSTEAPIKNFEDALTSSIDDVNKAFEVISKEEDDQKNYDIQSKLTESYSTEPEESKKAEDERKAKENPISQPKNFLGHPYNPVPSNKIDYKKEKNKPPNEITAEVNINDSVEIERKNTKVSKESQTFGKETIKNNKISETVSVTNENEEYIYKYSFRNVYLSNACHLCKKNLKICRVECSLCHLIFYCSQKHKEEDYVQHQSLCFAVSTLSHIKGTKHIYGDAQNITGYNYRLLRMQTIVSCEKILKRKLLPWEQEALLYPRMCAEPTCREWRNDNLKDCAGCGQISFCSSNPAHLPTIHQRWCASYSLYHKLVVHQLTEGRLEPGLPMKVLNCHNITDNINRLFADMYEEKINMNDIEYASLTQLATAPLTAAYGYQLYRNKMSQAFPRQDFKKPSFTIHVIGAELQFEADSLNKWEMFFLHIKPELQILNVVLIGPELNPAGLPTHLLGKIKMCPNCRVDKRRLEFSFQDNKYYHEYCSSDDYTEPDLICAFNPSIQRASSYTQNDQWISTLNCIIKQKTPFLVTSYTMTEMQRDMNAVRKLVTQRVNVISEPKFNPFASVRPDRNFISDDDMPLLFKNYCYMILIGAL